LTAKHYQGVLVNHVKTNEPYSPVDDCMENLPGVSLDVQLLNGGSVASCFVTYSVDEPVTKGAAIRSSDCLLETWQSLLVHSAYLKILALFQVLAFE